MTDPISSPMPTERRWFSRIPFAVGGSLSWREQEIAADIVDLSLKGALVRLSPEDAPPALGEDCRLRLALGDDEVAETIVMRAQVARLDAAQGQVGLRVTEIDLDSITHLRRLVELNLGDDALLHRELEHLFAGGG